MHFRHFILIGVFLGAAAFLPNNAFAENSGVAIQPEPQNSVVHTIVSEKIESPIASEKVVPATPENVNKSQGGPVQKPVTNPSLQQTVPMKPVPNPPNKTDRGMPSLEKKIKAGEAAGSAAKVNDTGQPEPAAKVNDTGQPEPAANVIRIGQTQPAKPNAVTNKLPEVPKSLSSNQMDSEVKTNRQPPGVNAKSETFTEDTDSSVSIKTSSSQTLAQKPHRDEEHKTPSDNRKIPWDIEIMDNTPQRTQSSGGQSNDQFSPGAGSISFIAIWSDWDEYLALNLGQDYISRQAKYCHQWINGPPSPPPKTAPFFLTFTVDLATGNDN